VSLAVATIACSNRNKNYNPITVYPAGADVMPADGSPPPVAPLPPLTPEQIGPTIDYTVKTGDSLWLIAKNYKTTISKLKRVNQLDTDMILAGQVLKIPVQPGAAAPATATPPKSVPAPGFRRPSTTATPPASPSSGPGRTKVQD